MIQQTIKASQIGNLTDARYFAAWGVEWLGFNLDPNSEAYTDPQTMHQIREWLVGPQIVGEFGVLQENETLQLAVQELQLAAVQVDHFMPVERVMALHSVLDVPIFKEVIVEDFSTLELLPSLLFPFKMYAAYIVLDLSRSGQSWAALAANKQAMITLQSLCADYRIFLTLQAEAADYPAVLERLKAEGLSLRGGEEEKVGYKSFDELDAIFEALEAVEH